MAIALVPLYDITMNGAARVLPNGPMGTRIILPIEKARVEGERLRGSSSS